MQSVVSVRVAASRELTAGWPSVVACAATAVFAWGFGSYGQAVYLAELQRTHGWSTTVIGAATTFSFLIGAGLLPFVGAAIERLGARVVMAAGITLLGAGTIGLSQTSLPWQLYPCNLLMGLGWVGITVTAISVTLAQWFQRQRGLALNLALTGASIGGFAVVPALVVLSHRQGFAAATPEVVIAVGAVVLPVVWLLLRPPARARPSAARATEPSPVPGGARAFLREWRFWSVAASFAMALAAQVGVLLYQVSYLLPALGSAGTSIALVITTLSSVTGRLGLGLVIDRLPQRATAAMIFAIQAGSEALLAALPREPTALYLASVLFGLCIGNVLTLPPLIFRSEFARASYGRVLGSSSAVGQVAYALIPVVLGAVRDLAGDLRAVIAVCIGLQLLAAIVMGLSASPRRLGSRQAGRHGRGNQDRVVPPYL